MVIQHVLGPRPVDVAGLGRPLEQVLAHERGGHGARGDDESLRDEAAEGHRQDERHDQRLQRLDDVAVGLGIGR